MSTDDFRVKRPNQSVREQTLNSLRNSLLSGYFKPGERLLERELCDLTGVSRTSVREALRQLETEGLVEILPGKGPIVSELDAGTAKDIYELREAIEAMAVRLFVEQASKKQLDSILAALDECIEAARKRDVSSMLTSSEAFSEILFEGSGNSLFAPLYRTLRARLSFLRLASTYGQSEEDAAEAVGHLERIKSAIQGRDADMAARACADRMRHAAALTIARMRKEAAGAEPESVPAGE